MIAGPEQKAEQMKRGARIAVFQVRTPGEARVDERRHCVDAQRRGDREEDERVDDLRAVVDAAHAAGEHVARDRHVEDEVHVQDDDVPGEDRAREVELAEVGQEVEAALGVAHVGDDEHERHDDGADREDLAEDRYVLDRAPVVDVGRDHEHDGRGGDADEEREVPDVEGPGDLVAHVRDAEPVADLLAPGEAAPDHEHEEEADPRVVETATLHHETQARPDRQAHRIIRSSRRISGSS